MRLTDVKAQEVKATEIDSKSRSPKVRVKGTCYQDGENLHLVIPMRHAEAMVNVETVADTSKGAAAGATRDKMGLAVDFSIPSNVELAVEIQGEGTRYYRPRWFSTFFLSADPTKYFTRPELES